MFDKKEQVSIRGLIVDTVPKVTLGRKLHIAIAKSQDDLDVNNGK